MAAVSQPNVRNLTSVAASLTMKAKSSNHGAGDLIVALAKGDVMQARKHVLYVSMAMSALWAMVVFAPIPVSAQGVAADQTSSLHDYVARTREVTSSDYQVVLQPDQGNLRVYRVILNPGLEGIAPFERVFDVSVESETGRVVGEHAVRFPD